MEESSQNQNAGGSTAVVVSSPKNNSTSRTLVIVMGIIVLLLVAGLFALNYLNIFSISSLFTPSPTAPIPSTISPTPVSKVSPAATSLEDRKNIPLMFCPVAKEICKAGEQTVKEEGGKKVYGLKFSNIPKNSILIASIGGKKATESGTTFTIDSKDRGMKIQYVVSSEFKSNPKLSSNVAEKDELGNFTGENNSLTIYVTATIVKESVKLGIHPDGEYLTNQE